MSSYSPPGVQSTLMGGHTTSGMEVKPGSARRARPPRDAIVADGRADLRRAGGRRRRRCRPPARAGRTRGRPGRDRAAAGPGLRHRAARVPAPGRASPCPSTCAWARRSAPARAATCAVTVDAPLDGPVRTPRSPTCTRSTRSPTVIHTSGTTGAGRAVELTYGNWLWSALGSAVALGVGRRGAVALRAAARPRRRPVDPAALLHLRDDGRRAPSLRHSTRRSSSCRRATLVSLVPTSSPGCWTPGCGSLRGCARCCSAAGRSPGAARAGARPRASPSSPTYGLTEACSQVTTGGHPLFCTRVELVRRRRDPRRRPDGRARRARCGRRAAHGRSRRLGRRRHAARSPGGRRTHRHRRRERRAGRGRGRARGAPRGRRGGGARRARTTSGAKRSSPPWCSRPERRRPARSCARTPRAPGRLQGAQGRRVCERTSADALGQAPA